MKDLNSIKKDLAGMAAVSLKMWRKANQAFMEHDPDLIAEALDFEASLNDYEKDITSDLVELARDAQAADIKPLITIYSDIAADLELIGDYCKDILERVQIKIEEKLLFSDDAVKEYEELYAKAEAALDEIACALERDNPQIVKAVLKGQGHIDGLIDEYRQKHNRRLIEGVCTPLACNMFLNMLDFTAAVYYHAKKIAKNLLKIEK